MSPTGYPCPMSSRVSVATASACSVDSFSSLIAAACTRDNTDSFEAATPSFCFNLDAYSTMDASAFLSFPASLQSDSNKCLAALTAVSSVCVTIVLFTRFWVLLPRPT